MTVLSKAQLENPMMFETLRDSVTALFKANENDLFQTIDHQEQSRSSETMKGILRTIQVFVQSTNPEHSSKTEFENDVTFQLHLRAAAASTGDLATLDDDNATPAQKQTALLAIDTGAAIADKAWDALLRIAIRIIMSPLNEDLGLDEFVVSNRILKTARKDAPVDHGNLIVITGSAFISASVTEIMDGATPVAGADPILESKLPFKTVSDSDESTASNLQVDTPNP